MAQLTVKAFNRDIKQMNFLQLVNLHFNRIEKSNLKPITLSNKRGNIKNFVDELGDMEVAEIKPIDIYKVLQRFINENRTNMARRLYIEARDIFYTAILDNQLDYNPVFMIKRPNDKVKRQRLTLNNFLAIRRFAVFQGYKWFVNALDLALVTGQRPSDLSKMSVFDIRDDYLYIEQLKSGERIALPIDLRLAIFDKSIREVIDNINLNDGHLLINNKGKQCFTYSLSRYFKICREATGIAPADEKTSPPSFYEVRSLSERLYRDQGINTQILLGHVYQTTTDMYNHRRGLNEWRILQV